MFFEILVSGECGGVGAAGNGELALSRAMRLNKVHEANPDKPASALSVWWFKRPVIRLP